MNSSAALRSKNGVNKTLQGERVWSVILFVLAEKLAQAKEENLDMHQVLDQTLLELNNL